MKYVNMGRDCCWAILLDDILLLSYNRINGYRRFHGDLLDEFVSEQMIN